MSTIDSLTSINEVHPELKLNKFFEEEEGDMIVMEFCDDLLKNVMSGLEAKYLEFEALQFIVDCGIEAIKKAVEINCYFHNVSYSSMVPGSWDSDVECETSPPDNWGAYKVPLLYSTEQKREEPEVKSEEGKEDVSIKNIFESTTRRLTTPSSSQSLDVSTSEILDGFSTSEDDVHHPSWDNLNKEQEVEDVADEEKASSVEETAALDISKTASEDFSKKLETQMDTYTGSSTFSKTAVGDQEKGLCVPQVTNVLTTNVVRELPGVESYIYVKKEKRGVKNVKPRPKILPKRRSDTNIKMAKVEEDQTKSQKKSAK